MLRLVLIVRLREIRPQLSREPPVSERFAGILK
jgi:hypothetical protein